MLKSDFNGYEEFMKKIGEATKEAGSGELLKLVFERQTMWLNKIADAILFNTRRRYAVYYQCA